MQEISKCSFITKKGLKLPRGIKFKIMIDYRQTFHNAHQGLVSNDHLRIASDLKKIAKLPLLNMPLLKNRYNRDHPIALGTDDDTYSYLPLRIVAIICNTNHGSGRLIGYNITDVINMISNYVEQTMREAINEWYADATAYHTPIYVGSKSLSLEELDKCFERKKQ